MITFMKRAVFLAVIATFLACSSAPAQSPSDVAARIGDRAITVKELDDRWRASDPAGHSETIQKLYDSRRSALEEIFVDMVFADAAKARGLSKDAYVESEISKRVKPVTEAEVAAFFQANVAQMKGQSLEVMAPAITRYLTEQQEGEARFALLNDLRKTGPAVRVMMELPRYEVTLTAADPSIGSAKAPVTLIEFSDFQCPYCRQVVPTLKKIRATYGDKVRIVWKDFPLTQIHPQAFKASEAGHCAAEQGKFWEFHDQVFGNQQALQPDDLKKYAAGLSLDAERFSGCLDMSKHAEVVGGGGAAGTPLGVNTNPPRLVKRRAGGGGPPHPL
jgi:protein-disulfide isomerase